MCRKALAWIAMLLLTATTGCTMCCGPYDDCGPLDGGGQCDNCRRGHRAGSADSYLAPLLPVPQPDQLISTDEDPSGSEVVEQMVQPDVAPRLVQPMTDRKVEMEATPPDPPPAAQTPTPAPMPAPNADSQGWRAKGQTRSILGSRQG
jgi:hypothetical protein